MRVNQVAGAANVSGEQPPRMVLIGGRGSKPAVAVMWTEKGGGRNQDPHRPFE